MYLALVVLVDLFDLVEWTHLYLQMGGLKWVIVKWGQNHWKYANLSLPTIPLDTLKYTADVQCPCPPASMSTDGSMYGGVQLHLSVCKIKI